VRITSSWSCEEAEVRDSRQQAQGFDSERCTNAGADRHQPLCRAVLPHAALDKMRFAYRSRLGTARQQLSARSDQRSLRAHLRLNYVLGLLCFR
jgi:hypothetical protein